MSDSATVVDDDEVEEEDVVALVGVRVSGRPSADVAGVATTRPELAIGSVALSRWPSTSTSTSPSTSPSPSSLARCRTSW